MLSLQPTDEAEEVSRGKGSSPHDAAAPPLFLLAMKALSDRASSPSAVLPGREKCGGKSPAGRGSLRRRPTGPQSAGAQHDPFCWVYFGRADRFVQRQQGL